MVLPTKSILASAFVGLLLNGMLSITHADQTSIADDEPCRTVDAEGQMRRLDKDGNGSVERGEDHRPALATDKPASSKMPAFSWNTLPLYIHVRKTAAFTPEEVNYLAKYPLITFEKTTGSETYGSYLEGFEHQVGGVSKADYIAKGIKTAQKAAAQGKIIALTLGIGETSLGDGVDEQGGAVKDLASISQQRLEYNIALFLILAEPYSYLCVHDGYDVNPVQTQGSVQPQGSASQLWLHTFPEYRKPLGPPKGPASKQGYQYTREFEHASVWLDIEASKGVVTWK